MSHAHRRDPAGWRIDPEWDWWFPLLMVALVCLPFIVHDLLT